MKLLRFGKQINKIITEAITGDDADEFGARVFDLSKKGCSLKIKVERQGDFPTYVSSRFASPTSIDDMTDSKIEDLLSNVSDLETVFPCKSYDELKAVLNEHFYCNSGSSTDDVWQPETVQDSKSEDKEESKTSTSSVDPLDDDKVKELLDGLGD